MYARLKQGTLKEGAIYDVSYTLFIYIVIVFQTKVGILSVKKAIFVKDLK